MELTVLLFSVLVVFVSCNKNTNQVVKLDDNVIEPQEAGPIKALFFTWEEWGHYEAIVDPITGEEVGHDCPGGGLCNFELKKIKLGKPKKTAKLNQNSQGGYYIDAIIDETFPMDEINNFQITNDLTQTDEDGVNYTISAGTYSYDSDINGFRLPVSTD